MRVQYADDAEDDEPLTYDIVEFVNNAMIAPKHVVDLAADVNETSVGHEQSEFKMSERGELLTVELKKTARPEMWAKTKEPLMKASTRSTTQCATFMMCRNTK